MVIFYFNVMKFELIQLLLSAHFFDNQNVGQEAAAAGAAINGA